MDILKAKDTIVEFIRTRSNEAGVDGAVVGISGGIDSALVAFLAVEALGKDHVLGIHLPELNVTPSEDVLDATEVANELGIEFKTINIGELMESFMNVIPDSVQAGAHVNGNLKARMRMSILYYYANLRGNIVLGTGNKTEILIGYFTKYGDGGVDIEPIGDLYKTNVREMARMVCVPEGILAKAPSAGLWEGQTDEDDLGMSYDMIDRILQMLLAGEDKDFVQQALGVSASQIDSLLWRVNTNAHKRIAPPIADLDEVRKVD
ncbi:MAG: NAD+ synthase [Euryarchaeota archaeon]|nr:NAD+ synthase [Euryarchaeota archaeon]